ncbi:hypothetical protein PMAYCL1PPCAC_29817, partial [Pristionchus mayeri]
IQMGKNKGKSHAGIGTVTSANQQLHNSSGTAQQAEPIVANEVPRAAEVEQLADQLNVLHVQNGEEANRDDVMAARKAKAAAKAEKAAKAAAKREAEAAAKTGGGGSTAVEPKQKNDQKKETKSVHGKSGCDMSKEELDAARKAAADKAKQQRAAKSADKPKHDHKQQQGDDSKSKSNLKQSPSSPKDNVKEVRFGVTRSESEENLMRAMIHAEHTNVKIDITLCDIRDVIHPAFYPLIDRCEGGDCEGIDELCLHFMECARQFIDQFSWPDEDQLGTMMDDSLNAQLSHLSQGDRYPLPYALGNIVRQLRKEIMNLDKGNNKMGKKWLVEWLEESEQQYFSLANSAISQHLQGKIAAASKIITYDWCPVVNHVLIDSVTKKTLKKLTVLDAVKNGPGIRHLTSLSHFSGYVEYGDLSAIGSIFERGSIVLLGCSAVLSSGRVCLPRGAFQLSLLARAANVPVLILAPTFKFVDRAQAATRFALLGKTPLDILPDDLITAIVTDIRLLPPSSAPAVLKAKALDDAN